MDRIIKFRAWYKKENRWITQNYHIDCNGDFYPYTDTNEYDWNIDCLQIEICQYTGRKDKYGVEIYESDLVNFTANYSTKPCGYMIGQVVFQENQWMLKNEKGLYSISEETDDFYCKSEVIGNIYENENLLK